MYSLDDALLSKENLFTKANSFFDKQENISLVPLLLPYLSSGQQKMIKARLKPEAAVLLTANAPVGLVLDKIRLHRKENRTDTAAQLIKKMKAIPNEQAEFLWVEQNILARRYIETQDYQEAYQLIQKHALSEGESFANAEWLSGWLALRFLHQPQRALEHFKKLSLKVKSPISVARAQYWLGRTYQTLKEATAAREAFQKAASHPATYYGQLALKELHGKNVPISFSSPSSSPEMKRKFESHALVPYLRLLLAVQDFDRAEAFAIALAKTLTSPAEQALLVQLMHEKGNAYLGVQTAKKATKTVAPLIAAAYPHLGIVEKCGGNPAFTHAIIRQESRFKATAVSPAGATGLMQLMAATAHQTVKKHKLKAGSLTSPSINIAIGVHHIKDLLERYNGSLILAAAAYNAGSKAVDEWIETFGDPRSEKINTIDWVELIPYAETRNYVQRVLENYYCYKRKSPS